MIQLVRTDSSNAHFKALVLQLDQYLREMDGEEHSFFAQFNKIDTIKHVVLAYKEGTPAGCGAFKEFTKDTAEIKRMFVHPLFRRQGIAQAILSGLEIWASQLHYSDCLLETGKQQLDAIKLYQQAGYQVIPNYGQYKDVVSSVCMNKRLKSFINA